ncbi:phosphorylase superfamily [Cladorrhinum sp. PSN259]|nr:phosphorylase superfamily [Cladorrhinum sp. PSN259]
MATRPANRDDFQIAIVCALRREYDAVCLLIDEFWDEDGDPYGRAPGDPNYYRTGRIGDIDVVLVHLSEMGKVSAASAAASVRSSYPGLELALLTGICGGVPRADGDEEILLGDVVLAGTVVQYDLGKQYPGVFQTKDTIEGSLGRSNKKVRNLLAVLASDSLRERLEARTATILQDLQDAAPRRQLAKYQYPGAACDKLYRSDYRHKHQLLAECLVCANLHSTCEASRSQTCDQLRCDDACLVPRERLRASLECGSGPLAPRLFFGRIGSGDTVIKSGEDRDRIAKEQGLIAFEMEGAGIRDEIPCIVVKGVCDYADSHKNKRWQDYAAATAASAMKALLERYPKTDEKPAPPRRYFIVPFGRNDGFVGRHTILDQLLSRIPPNANKDNCQYTIIEGLGGVGKTQAALEAAYRVRDGHADCSVFWVPALDTVSFENAYRNIGRELGVKGIDKDDADVKSLVKTALGECRTSWLLVVDNADDMELVFGGDRSRGLRHYLPFSRQGSILVTTRNHMVAVRFDQRNIITLAQMDQTEAVELLQHGQGSQTDDADSERRLVDFLDNLPLAIKQASAYMAKTRISAARYLRHCRSSNKALIQLLSKDFDDQGRYQSIENPIATTWLISFEHIARDNSLAAQYLRFICFLGEKDIPLSLLPPTDDELEVDEAIATLKAYAFIIPRGEESFDIHRLVRLAMRNWLKEKGELTESITDVVTRLATVFPFAEHENREIWMKYLPHTQVISESSGYCTDKEAESDLLFSIAESYSEIAKYEEAERIYRQALELKEKVLGREHRSTLDSMNNLGLVLQNQGKYEEGEQIHRQALKLKEEVLGREHPSTLDSIDNLGIMLRRQGKYKEAEQMHRQALSLYEKVVGREHLSTLKSMNNLGLVLESQGKYKEAEQIHRQELSLCEKVLGREHPSTLDSMNNLGLVLMSQGKYEEAEQIHRQALKLKEEVLGREHRSTLDSMDNLGLVLERQGKYEEAEQIHRQALELKEKVLGHQHPSTLYSMDYLGIVLKSQGKYEEAEQMHRQALELRGEVLGREHPSTLDSMNNLGRVLESQGKYEEAEQMHRQVLELREKVLGRQHPDTVESRKDLADCLVERSRNLSLCR